MAKCLLWMELSGEGGVFSHRRVWPRPVLTGAEAEQLCFTSGWADDRELACFAHSMNWYVQEGQFIYVQTRKKSFSFQETFNYFNDKSSF